MPDTVKLHVCNPTCAAKLTIGKSTTTTFYQPPKGVVAWLTVSSREGQTPTSGFLQHFIPNNKNNHSRTTRTIITKRTTTQQKQQHSKSNNTTTNKMVEEQTPKTQTPAAARRRSSDATDSNNATLGRFVFGGLLHRTKIFLVSPVLVVYWWRH